LRRYCGTSRRVDSVRGSLAKNKMEMAGNRSFGRGLVGIGLGQYRFLFPQILRRLGESKERAVQACAEDLRGADHAKPLHGVAWEQLPGSGGGGVAVPVRRRFNAVSCGGARV